MKITGLKTLHADFGWRTLSFLKLETDQGIVGWSEYYEGAGNAGLTAVMMRLGELLIGDDPRRVEAISTKLGAATIQAVGGLNQQAIAALTNACVDAAAKALGVPVHAMWGGAVRDKVQVYWSHFASYRVRYAKVLGVAAPKTYDDLSKLAENVRAKGFWALKTNIVLPGDGGFVGFQPTRAQGAGYPELNISPEILSATIRQMQAIKDGAGPGVGLMLDVNFFFRPEAMLRLARALETFDLEWLEVDSYDVGALQVVKQQSRVPIGSLEHLYGRRGYKPFLDARAVDVPIIDPIWNGFVEAVKIAQLCDAYEMNAAPHNYYGDLADYVSLNLAALMPNLRTMEHDPDTVPWRQEFYTHPLEVTDGTIAVPDRPGWGTDIDEKGVAKHPPRK